MSDFYHDAEPVCALHEKPDLKGVKCGPDIMPPTSIDILDALEAYLEDQEEREQIQLRLKQMGFELRTKDDFEKLLRAQQDEFYQQGLRHGKEAVEREVTPLRRQVTALSVLLDLVELDQDGEEVYAEGSDCLQAARSIVKSMLRAT